MNRSALTLWLSYAWPLVLALALAAELCNIVQWRYAIFRSDVDLGLFTQVIDGLGRGFSSTVEGSVNHLLVHWSPIIVTAWPFLRLFGPIGLEYFQAVLIAATLLPLWALARTRVKPLTAIGLIAVASLYPILWANGVGDFHEMAFVPVLSAALVYALDRRRWLVGILVTVLLACTKEDQFVVLAANGVLFAVTAGRDRSARRAGLGVSGVAALGAVLYFGVVRSVLDAHVPYESLRFYDWSHVETSLKTLLFLRGRYLLMVLGPLAFLPCISRYGLFLIPGVVEIFASSQPITLFPGTHYSALLTGYALAAFIDAAARLGVRSPLAARSLVVAAAAASIWVGIYAAPMEYWYYLYRRPNAHDALLETTLRRLPASADVGSEDEIFAHLGLDPHASIDFDGQEWFVYDRTEYSDRWHDIDEPAVRRALAAHTYRIVSDRNGIVVLRRGNPNEGRRARP
ncbi:MAG TPA: DUF2079 domain-containing protein [Candidatus Tumulicola sp.]|nr:DUF2079 domain-containing protein [Candidatus Tumulicola sp.]